MLLLKCTKIVSVWGSAPDPARGAYVSSTTFFSRPTMALSPQPPQLFSLVTPCRLHSAFQRSAYDYIIISSFVQFCPKHATYRRMCKCCVTYLQRSSIHPSCSKMESRKGLIAYIQEYHTVEPLHQILAKAPSFGLYLDHIMCIFLKKGDPCYAKMHSLKMHQNCG